MARTDTNSESGTFSRVRLQGVGIMGIRVCGAALALAAQILASRLLGAEDFGRYSLLLVWLLVLGYAATAGSGQLVCRYLAQYAASRDQASIAGLLRAALVTVLAVGVVLVGAAVAVVVFFPLGLSKSDVLLACLALSAIPLVALQDFLESIARGLDRPALGIGPAFLVRHLAIIFGLLALLALGGSADALMVMGFTVAGLVASILTQYALLRRHLRDALSGVQPRYDLYRWVTRALPMAGADITEMLLLNADILILGLFVAPEYVAFYFAATRLAQILAYVPYGATAATAQKYAVLAGRSKSSELQALIGKVATYSTVLTGMGALLLSLFAAQLLAAFGPEYAQAAPIVALLCLGIVVSCAFGPGEDVLNMLGQERVCSLAFLSALAVNIALNFALIPLLGLTGAALATVSALALRGALLAYFARVRLGLVLPAFLSLLRPTHDREIPYET
ncbi:MAG: oligosaccharide flippase family protein [Methyloceanibacter sp.]|uniref:oligosaccharide flippase family protein n=1 Tax=Methyloceanibacter sp. TaxID=1965321 RepID=UPI003EE22593